MRLAPRLVLMFGSVAALSVASLGYVVREDRRQSETRRFAQEVSSACDRVVAEIDRQAERDRKLVAGACQSGELVDRALIWLEAGNLDDQHRLALSRLVPEERQAFDLDELLLATAEGDRLGQDPLPSPNLPRDEIAKLVAADVSLFSLRLSGEPREPSQPLEPAVVTRCRSVGSGGRSVGLVATRHLTPLVDRLGKTVDARVTLDGAPASGDMRGVAQANCWLSDPAGRRLPILVTKPTTELVENLARIDQTVVVAGLASTGVALLLAVLLARSLGRPISELASEARKVAAGEARPLRVHGAGEIAELAQAFDTMLVDLEATRRRLAATSRAAAWREVARRVAHEIKNPLAPIRAAVETLRRLRARDDPEFYAYFDEATRIVLDEVHRISNIVTEFTRFARLSPPRPQPLDVTDLARQVARLHDSGPRGARIHVVVDRVPPSVRADRDQIVQVLTNLVQNALDAVQDGAQAGEVRIAIDTAGPGHVSVTVSDDGPGIAPEIAARLFEPYATTKPHGTGLGLAIAQRIAIEHNGELSYVAGGAARGATFRLVLPVEGPPQAIA